jgi:hypothetical protein
MTGPPRHLAAGFASLTLLKKQGENMNNRALLSAVALAFAVAGCDSKAPATPAAPKPTSAPAQVVQNAAPEPAKAEAKKARGNPTKKCDEKGVKCDVKITVTSCAPDGSGITLDHDVLGVLKNSGEVEIRWTIDTDGFEFDGDNGIVFKPGVDWKKEFDSLKGNKNKFKLQDKNHLGTPAPRDYPYTVNIVKKGGAACASKDPTIINDV